jgi:hypothetical protein
MALRDWFVKRSPLQLALERGLKPGGDVGAELRQLGDYPVKSQSDAEAICLALEHVARGAPAASALHALTSLFQDVPDAECEAFPILQQRGCPLLIQILDQGLRDENRHAANDLLFVLKVLAMYGTPEGTEAVVRAARLPLKPDGYMWSVIFHAYQKGHPGGARLFEGLSRPLPAEFLAVALLDAANRMRLEGGALAHPFDSPEGKQRLEQWLTDTDPEHFSYAVSAAAALPFIGDPERDRLLSRAFDHSSVDVQLEAAWSAAKLGREAGLDCLARYCREVAFSNRAKQYLAELNRADLIPPESLTPDFQALAEFAQWLAHPNELGRPPDEMEIIDHRELSWPPSGRPKPFWLIRYRVKKAPPEEDDVEVGLVGSVTFCLFTYQLAQRPPEDGYAIHCYWEMEGRRSISEAAVEEGSNEYDAMLRQWTGAPLADAKITHVAELSPELGYPQRLARAAPGIRVPTCRPRSR